VARHGNRRGLPRRWTEQAKDLTLRDVETNALHSLDFAKGFVQVVT